MSENSLIFKVYLNGKTFALKLDLDSKDFPEDYEDSIRALTQFLKDTAKKLN